MAHRPVRATAALSRRSLAAAAAQYVPELRRDDFAGGFAGVRAQALGRDGRLVDDFVVSETERAPRAQRALARGHPAFARA